MSVHRAFPSRNHHLTPPASCLQVPEPDLFDLIESLNLFCFDTSVLRSLTVFVFVCTTLPLPASVTPWRMPDASLPATDENLPMRDPVLYTRLTFLICPQPGLVHKQPIMSPSNTLLIFLGPGIWKEVFYLNPTHMRWRNRWTTSVEVFRSLFLPQTLTTRQTDNCFERVKTIATYTEHP